MESTFAVASFRSRQQVIGFEKLLKAAGVNAEIVSTPREIALGCGLSVKFACADIERVRAICRARPPQNMIGIYRHENGMAGHSFMPVAGASGV